MKLKNKLVLYFSLTLILIYFVISIYGIIKMPTWGDERDFHVPLVQNINITELFEQNSSYSSAYTPLPYFILKPVYYLIPSLFTLRIANLLILFIGVYFVYLISRKLNIEPIFSIALFLSNPFLLRASYTFVMSNWGITFALVSLYYYFFAKNKQGFILAHLFLGISVLCMQWMLMLYPALLMHELDNKKCKVDFEILKNGIFKIVSLIPVLILFYYWGGLTHPNFQAHSIEFSPQHFNSVLATIGFMGICFLIFIYKEIKWEELKYLIFLFPILYLTLPMHSMHHGPEQFTGIVSAFWNKFQVFTGISYNSGMFFSSIAGIVLLLSMKKILRTPVQFVCYYIIIGLLVAFSVSTNLGSSHVFILFSFLIFVILPKIHEKVFWKGILILQWGLITLTYNIYIIFFCSEGVLF